MERFASLVGAIDRSNSTLDKVAAMCAHFRSAPAEDCAWAVYFLAGGRPRRLVATRVLREAALEVATIPEWLFDECYETVGDLAETIALLLPDMPCDRGEPIVPLQGFDLWMRSRLLPLRALEPDAARRALHTYWALLDHWQRFVFNKLITGGLRLGVSRQLVLRSLGEASGVDARLIAQRIIGFTDRSAEPDADWYRALIAPAASAASASGEGSENRTATVASEDHATRLLPYPFMLANTWDVKRGEPGPASQWLAEWKWDGIRAQLVRRGDGLAVWSRGEELLTDRFPEIVAAARALPAGTVLDGELLCWLPEAARPMDFAAMQTRIGRLRPGAATLRQAPVVFIAFDCLERDHVDLRSRPLAERRQAMLDLLSAAGDPAFAPVAAGAARSPAPGVLRVAQVLSDDDWALRAILREQARMHGAEGLMLKRVDSVYGIGRTRADGSGWFKWKLDPLSIDAVLIYAQAGHGRRAGLYTDYTFAVWDPATEGEPRLVPFAKAYSGLSDAEIREVDAIIRRTTVERFGPVRSVTPTLVFEIGFEGIARSARHRAGVSVRFPRMLRWRRDKSPAQADTLATLRELLALSRA